ncbi:NmrA/HSCARG family protein [Sphingomonas aquatilis]|uniref:NmrA/HSCARG family protein n=1 Tax=Sphingomonas aquatilis TaxID=93063 RepID=UPI0023F6724B|nr:NmrA/HSCARG family protein [Sphingomonas aquatilis]MCI4655907.1 NmrA/HSCARG family protein [Sphingomonas aquatilis]
MEIDRRSFDMENLDRVILVLGATGQQGGSVTRALTEDGWAVRALVRDPTSERALALSAIGVETVAGNLGDLDSLKAAAAGAYGVFSVQPSSGQPEYGVTDEDEARFGASVAEAAQDAGVEHLVYSSVAGAGPGTGIGHFESKWRVEEHVRGLPLDWTVLRPTAFMEILLWPQFGLAERELTFFMLPNREMQFIAVEDIGRIAAKVFADRAAFRNQTFEIAGDSATGDDLAEKIGTAIGRRITYRRFPDPLLRDAPWLARLVELVEQGPAAGHADLDNLRSLHPGLLTFDAWLNKSGGALISSL